MISVIDTMYIHLNVNYIVSNIDWSHSPWPCNPQHRPYHQAPQVPVTQLAVAISVTPLKTKLQQTKFDSDLIPMFMMSCKKNACIKPTQPVTGLHCFSWHAAMSNQKHVFTILLCFELPIEGMTNRKPSLIKIDYLMGANAKVPATTRRKNYQLCWLVSPAELMR